MGIIDKSHHTLTCIQCDKEETQTILDKGSGWSGSHWQQGASYQHFNVDWSNGGGKEEPDLLEASCKNCGGKPTIQQWYTQ